MAEIDKIRIDDVGTVFRIRVLDGTVPANLSACLIKEIKFRKPDKTTVVQDADFYTDGADGYIQYVTISGDIDQSGIWSIQAHIAFTEQDWHTTTDTFLVSHNL